MEKRQIQGSQYADTNLEYSVCSHLQEILDLLVEHGNSFDHSLPLERLRGGSTRFVAKPINFDLIERTFELPKFIELNKGQHCVICRRCWCDIAEGSQN